uniref:Polyprotein n=1 Tax=Macrophomina phaseolina endornavirus 1 TaxID=2741640 RepID=A0A7U3UAA0_9VIRU|nr:polyprotein [Macrophomina phaseolina endornavirus 1]
MRKNLTHTNKPSEQATRQPPPFRRPRGADEIRMEKMRALVRRAGDWWHDDTLPVVTAMTADDLDIPLCEGWDPLRLTAGLLPGPADEALWGCQWGSGSLAALRVAVALHQAGDRYLTAERAFEPNACYGWVVKACDCWKEVPGMACCCWDPVVISKYPEDSAPEAREDGLKWALAMLNWAGWPRAAVHAEQDAYGSECSRLHKLDGRWQVHGLSGSAVACLSCNAINVLMPGESREIVCGACACEMLLNFDPLKLSLDRAILFWPGWWLELVDRAVRIRVSNYPEWNRTRAGHLRDLLAGAIGDRADAIIAGTKLGKVLDARDEATARKIIQMSAGREVHVDGAMSEDILKDLVRTFPDYEIIPTLSSPHKHGFHHACRVMLEDRFLRRIGTHVPVYDVGGAVHRHVRRKRFNVHSCRPILSPDDYARHAEHNADTSNMLGNHARKAAQDTAGRPVSTWGPVEQWALNARTPKLVACESPAEACTFRAKVPGALLYVDSLYDVRPETVLAQMCNHNANRFLACMTIPPAVWSDTSGWLAHNEGRWVLRDEWLHLSFRGSSQTYRNNFNNARLFFENPVWLAKSAGLYIRVQGYYGDHVCLEGFGGPIEYFSANLQYFTMWFDEDTDTARFTIPRPSTWMDALKQVAKPDQGFKVNRKFLELVRSRLLANPKTDVDSVLAFARAAQNAQYHLSSGRMSRFRLSTDEVVDHVIVALVLHAKILERIEPYKAGPRKVDVWDKLKKIAIDSTREVVQAGADANPLVQAGLEWLRNWLFSGQENVVQDANWAVYWQLRDFVDETWCSRTYRRGVVRGLELTEDKCPPRPETIHFGRGPWVLHEGEFGDGVSVRRLAQPASELSVEAEVQAATTSWVHQIRARREGQPAPRERDHAGRPEPRPVQPGMDGDTPTGDFTVTSDRIELHDSEEELVASAPFEVLHGLVDRSGAAADGATLHEELRHVGADDSVTEGPELSATLSGVSAAPVAEHQHETFSVPEAEETTEMAADGEAPTAVAADWPVEALPDDTTFGLGTDQHGVVGNAQHRSLGLETERARKIALYGAKVPATVLTWMLEGPTRLRISWTSQLGRVESGPTGHWLLDRLSLLNREPTPGDGLCGMHAVHFFAPDLDKGQLEIMSGRKEWWSADELGSWANAGGYNLVAVTHPGRGEAWICSADAPVVAVVHSNAIGGMGQHWESARVLVDEVPVNSRVINPRLDEDGRRAQAYSRAAAELWQISPDEVELDGAPSLELIERAESSLQAQWEAARFVCKPDGDAVAGLLVFEQDEERIFRVCSSDAHSDASMLNSMLQGLEPLPDPQVVFGTDTLDEAVAKIRCNVGRAIIGQARGEAATGPTYHPGPVGAALDWLADHGVKPGDALLVDGNVRFAQGSVGRPAAQLPAREWRLYTNSLVSLIKRWVACGATSGDWGKVDRTLGGPGSGKTRALHESDLPWSVVVPTRRLKTKLIQSLRGRGSVHTVEEALCLPSDKGRRIWLDEAGSVSGDDATILCGKFGPMMLSGDPDQIGPVTEPTVATPWEEWAGDALERLPVSGAVVKLAGTRMPGSVERFLLLPDGGKAGTLTVQKLRNEQAVREALVRLDRAGTLVLVFRTSELKRVRTLHLDADVEKVHSFQGGERERVIVVQLRASGVSGDPRYLYSAFTRACRELIVLTLADTTDTEVQRLGYMALTETRGGWLPGCFPQHVESLLRLACWNEWLLLDATGLKLGPWGPVPWLSKAARMMHGALQTLNDWIEWCAPVRDDGHGEAKSSRDSTAVVGPARTEWPAMPDHSLWEGLRPALAAGADTVSNPIVRMAVDGTVVVASADDPSPPPRASVADRLRFLMGENLPYPANEPQGKEEEQQLRCVSPRPLSEAEDVERELRGLELAMPARRITTKEWESLALPRVWRTEALDWLEGTTGEAVWRSLPAGLVVLYHNEELSVWADLECPVELSAFVVLTLLEVAGSRQAGAKAPRGAGPWFSLALSFLGMMVYVAALTLVSSFVASWAHRLSQTPMREWGPALPRRRDIWLWVQSLKLRAGFARVWVPASWKDGTPMREMPRDWLSLTAAELAVACQRSTTHGSYTMAGVRVVVTPRREEGAYTIVLADAGDEGCAWRVRVSSTACSVHVILCRTHDHACEPAMLQALRLTTSDSDAPLRGGGKAELVSRWSPWTPFPEERHTGASETWSWVTGAVAASIGVGSVPLGPTEAGTRHPEITGDSGDPHKQPVSDSKLEITTAMDWLDSTQVLELAPISAPQHGSIRADMWAFKPQQAAIITLGGMSDHSRPALVRLYSAVFNAVSRRLFATKRYRVNALDTLSHVARMGRVYCQGASWKVAAEPVALDEEATVAWVEAADNPQALAKEMQAVCERAFLTTGLDHATVFAKRETLTKEALKDSSLDGMARVIVFHSRAVAAVMSPPFMQLKDRLKNRLLDHIVYVDGTRFDEVEALVRNTKARYVLSNDLEKQDAQTDADQINVEMAIYEQLGVDSALLNLWRLCHEQWHLSGPAGMSAKRNGMRWTGQATTALGNAINDLCINCKVVERLGSALKLMIFLGDDNTMFVDQVVDLSDLMALTKAEHNTVCTPTFSESYGSFCTLLISRQGESGWRVYPDLARLIDRVRVLPSMAVEMGDVEARLLSYCHLIGGIPSVVELCKEKGWPEPPLAPYGEAELLAAQPERDISWHSGPSALAAFVELVRNPDVQRHEYTVLRTKEL